MEQHIAIERLRDFAPEMRQAGISRLFLYGSVARNEACMGSDIDLAFEVDRSRSRFSLLDQAKMQIRLSEYLGEPVDFLEREAIRKFARHTADADMIEIF
ncbi:MAG: nucleotidyltransferase domain-containing protein [Pacificimonas sp.]